MRLTPGIRNAFPPGAPSPGRTEAGLAWLGVGRAAQAKRRIGILFYGGGPRSARREPGWARSVQFPARSRRSHGKPCNKGPGWNVPHPCRTRAVNVVGFKKVKNVAPGRVPGGRVARFFAFSKNRCLLGTDATGTVTRSLGKLHNQKLKTPGQGYPQGGKGPPRGCVAFSKNCCLLPKNATYIIPGSEKCMV